MNAYKTIIIIFIFSLLFLVHSAVALKPTFEYDAIPSDYGIIYREVSIPTADSLNLNGWFFPAQDTTGILNFIVGHIPVPEEYKPAPREYIFDTENPAPTIIVANGDGGNMMYLILYAYNFCTRGYNVLLFDWRGFGHSDPFEMDRDMLCCTEFLTDY